MIYFIFILFFILILYLNNIQESFRSDINNKLCLDNYNTCLNYNECCSRKNFYKLGHAKQCIHVKKHKNCNIYRDKKNIIRRPLRKKIYVPGYSFIPFYNWNNSRAPVCHGKNIVPKGSIGNRRVYNSQKVDNSIKHPNTENEHHEDHNNNFITDLERIVHNKLSRFIF